MHYIILQLEFFYEKSEKLLKSALVILFIFKNSCFFIIVRKIHFTSLSCGNTETYKANNYV